MVGVGVVFGVGGISNDSETSVEEQDGCRRVEEQDSRRVEE